MSGKIDLAPRGENNNGPRKAGRESSLTLPALRLGN
jgi:hypothetical protein